MGTLGIPVRGIGRVPGLGRLASARRHQFHDVELNGWAKRACHALSIDETRCPFRASLWEYKPKPGQTVEQVWFPGTHGDIGGTGAEAQLSIAPYQWMAAQASALGLALDADDGLPSVRPRPSPGLLDGIWKWLPTCAREIGKDGTQWLHPTARDNFEQSPSYRPRNLAAYLESPGSRIYGEDGN